MAMLARYHEWPVRSTGMVDYVNPMSGEWIQYPLGQEDYDWDNMLTTYNDSIGYTEEEARAVATLVRDMGGAVRMMYGYDLSAAYTPDVATALVSNMGYSQRIQVPTDPGLSSGYLRRCRLDGLGSNGIGGRAADLLFGERHGRGACFRVRWI